MQPDITTPAVMTVREYADATGQTAAAVRAQIVAGTCAADVVILRKPDPGRPGGRPRYGITRASVARLLGEAAP
jgi:hypothetical protein